MQFTKHAFGFKTLLLCKDSTLIKIHAKKKNKIKPKSNGVFILLQVQNEFKDQYGGRGTEAGQAVSEEHSGQLKEGDSTGQGGAGFCLRILASYFFSGNMKKKIVCGVTRMAIDIIWKSKFNEKHSV